MTPRRICLLLMMTVFAMAASAAGAHEAVPAILREVGFDQRLDAQVPLDLTFSDERGKAVSLRDVIAGRPVLLTLNEYECKNLCPFELEGLAASLRQTAWPLGDRFVVVTVSIDPRETAAVASARKRGFVGGYFPAAQHDGWRFLTAADAAIHRLADSVGFRYAYDSAQRQYAHPTGVVVLTADGRVARYLFGLDYRPRDVKLALVEASQGRVGSAIDHALLACYRYDAVAGRYTPMVMRLVQFAGAVTVLGMSGLLFILFRRGRA